MRTKMLTAKNPSDLKGQMATFKTYTHMPSFEFL
jgi:hypothetical protein